jgi:hypothetical protein
VDLGVGTGGEADHVIRTDALDRPSNLSRCGEIRRPESRVLAFADVRSRVVLAFADVRSRVVHVDADHGQIIVGQAVGHPSTETTETTGYDRRVHRSITTR